MRKITGFLAAAIVAGASSSAMADGLVGPYIGLSGGVNFGADSDYNVYNRDANTRSVWSPDTDTGYAASIQAGYAMGGPRIEAEITWRHNGISGYDDTTGGVKTAYKATDSSIQSIALMGNLYYDIPTGSAWTPYVGAGAGVAHLNWNPGRLTHAGTSVDLGGSQSDSLFAYQGIAGLAYNIDNNLSLKLDYRYFATLDPRFDYNSTVVKSSYDNHTVMLGFSYNFGSAPMAVEAPVVAERQSFLVFFDFAKSNITHEGSTIVRQAADAAKAGRPTRIEAIGHTDTVGSASYNLALSKRRAEAVKAELIRNGVPAHIIETVGRGFSDLLVPTGDNVREPQNRRVQIIF